MELVAKVTRAALVSVKIDNNSPPFSGADNETRIVVTRIRGTGSESDQSSFRFCEVCPQSIGHSVVNTFKSNPTFLLLNLVAQLVEC